MILLLCCVLALAGSLRLYTSVLLKFQSRRMVKVSSLSPLYFLSSSNIHISPIPDSADIRCTCLSTHNVCNMIIVLMAILTPPPPPPPPPPNLTEAAVQYLFPKDYELSDDLKKQLPKFAFPTRTPKYASN